MNSTEAALKAACLILAEKQGCPSDVHCYDAGHRACDIPCWQCWYNDLGQTGAAYVEVCMRNHPEEFVPEPRSNFGYEPHDVYEVMSAAEELWQAEYKFRLREAVKLELRKRNLLRATEPIIRKCQKAILKAMPDINETVQAKYHQYRDEDPAIDEYEEVDLGEDPFGN